MLVTGNSNGHVLGWDLNTNSTSPSVDFLAHNDCTNGIRYEQRFFEYLGRIIISFLFSIHPKYPLLATSSGQRRFAGDVRVTMSEDEDEENLYAEFNLNRIPRENCIKIWSFTK